MAAKGSREDYPYTVLFGIVGTHKGQPYSVG